MIKNFIKQTPFGLSIIIFAIAIGLLAIIAPINGNKALIVQSGSMEPAIKVGDLVVAKPRANYRAGDVISFKDPAKPAINITHRIVGNETKNGQFFFITRGDANNAADTIPVPQSNIIGKADFGIKGVGKIFAYAKTKMGFVTLIGIPASFVILMEIISILGEIKKPKVQTVRTLYRKTLRHLYHHYGKPMGVPHPSASFKSLLLSLRGASENERRSNLSLSRLLRFARNDNIALSPKILLPFLTSFLIIGSTFALFSNSGTSTNNVFSASSQFPTSPTPSPSPTPPPIAQTLIINEVLPVSSCVDGQKDTNWIEVWNGSSSPVDLKNFKISDGTHITDLVTANFNLDPGKFALIAKDGSIFNHGNSPGNKCFADNGSATLNLGNSAPVSLTTGILKLLAADGTTVIDRVEFGTPPLNPPTDQSIERNPLGEDSALADTFSPSDFKIQCPPTPGTWVAPLGQCKVLISEIQTATPSATLSDFVELYNPTSSSINLDNYRLVKRTSSGIVDVTLKVFTSSNIIPAHGFFLWASTDGGYATQVGADASSSGNIASDNSVALRNGLENTGTILDALAWGSPTGTPLVEGSPFVTNPAEGKGVERKAYFTSTQSTMEGGADSTNGNGFDSDHNSTDLILRNVSEPQNSSSPAETP